LWFPVAPGRKLACWSVIALAITDEQSTIVLATDERTSPFKATWRTVGPLVDDEQLRPVRPHHRLHLLQHCPGSSGGLE